jgi:hypothetical protein
MEDLSDEVIFQAIGVAVVASQVFEKMFVITVRFAVKQSDIHAFKEIKSIETAAAFKQATKSLLNEVSGNVHIESLEDRIDQLIEDRNRIVHRLVEESPWPGPITDDQRREILALCQKVRSESVAIANALTPLITAWVKRFPEIEHG